jgi:aldehyde:ferredoxin oxidoreductase
MSKAHQLLREHLGLVKVTFHDAKDLWGKDTYFTEDEVLKKVNQKGTGKAGYY